MLSLKSATIGQVATTKIGLLDLPPELLRSVFNHVCMFDDLLATSLVSKTLREAILPILYGSVNLTFSKMIWRNGETNLDFLLKRPHLWQHVREVIFRPSFPRLNMKSPVDLKKFERLSLCLKNLRSLRICVWDELLVWLLTLPWSDGVRINISDPLCEFESGLKHQGDLCPLDDHRVVALSFQLPYPSCVRPPDGKGADHLLRLAEVRNYLGRFSALRSLAMVIKADHSIRSTYYTLTSLNLPETDCALPSLREVHLGLPMARSRTLEEGIIHFLEIIPWSQLRRLSLTGSALIEEVIQAFRTYFVSLHSLHLEAVRWVPTFPRTVRRFQNEVRRHPGEGTWSASSSVVIQTSSLLGDQAPEELSLEGFGRDLPLEVILSPKLRKLKLHMCELLSVCIRRQAPELQLLSRLAPNIEHLELDVARIENLWHATAVPGVDVDVRIYQVLDAITALPHLKSLRLFPQYLDGDNFFDSRLTQPLTDDAAVRLFRKLKEKSTSLEKLAISSDNHVAELVEDFDPMSWELRADGEKIILTVRQAKHDYEQRQVWVGERRLKIEIRRFSYRRSYIPEFEGWIMGC